jgi:hypothetical protein
MQDIKNKKGSGFENLDIMQNYDQKTLNMVDQAYD